MKKTLRLLEEQLMGFSDNINDDLVSTVKVNSFGNNTSLKHISLISQQDGKVSITPYNPIDMAEILRALKSKGFDAYKFSKTTIVVNIPLTSGETRRKVQKQINELAEQTRVSIRNIRKKFKKKSDIDNNDLQVLTDAYTRKINELVSV